MSASDAAPLPRLGEVFFDVRGNSRSMRLSWYADTGVAVFSIWQGGTCTGTFRLPMDDLTRMIEALRRGPQGQRVAREGPAESGPGRERPPGRGASPGAGATGAPDSGQATVSMRLPGAGEGAAPPQRPEERRDAGYPAAGYGTGPRRGYRPDSGGYPVDPLDPSYPVDPAAAGYRDAGSGEFRAAGGPGYPDVPSTGDYRRVGADPAGYPDEAPGGYHRGSTSSGFPPGYTEPGYADPGYQDGPATGGYPRAPGGRRQDSGAYPDPAGYRDPGYQDAAGGGDYRSAPSGSHRRDSGGYPPVPADYRAGQPGSLRRESAGYSGDQAYPDDASLRRYSRQQGIADYTAGPGAGDSGGYPVSPDYERGRDWGEDTADQALGGYGADAAPESHPYGRPPANREPRERGRYPGRH